MKTNTSHRNAKLIAQHEQDAIESERAGYTTIAEVNRSMAAWLRDPKPAART